MKVLVVDDNALITDLLKEYMELEGFETDAAQNGIEAVDKLKSGEFQTVITDGYMPFMSGFELCRFIKSHYPAIYTIGITDSLHLDQFREAGADDFFYKPVDFSILCSLVKNQKKQQHHAIA